MSNFTIHCGHKELQVERIRVTIRCKECGFSYSFNLDVKKE